MTNIDGPLTLIAKDCDSAPEFIRIMGIRDYLDTENISALFPKPGYFKCCHTNYCFIVPNIWTNNIWISFTITKSGENARRTQVHLIFFFFPNTRKKNTRLFSFNNLSQSIRNHHVNFPEFYFNVFPNESKGPLWQVRTHIVPWILKK